MVARPPYFFRDARRGWPNTSEERTANTKGENHWTLLVIAVF